MTTATTSTKALHESLLKELASEKYSDGTYNLATMESVDFSNGYQVTFCQIGDDYTADDYDFLVAMFTESSTDGNVYAGKFESTPEISFHFSDKAMAIRYAKMFNQISIWDWNAGHDIKTGGTGAR